MPVSRLGVWDDTLTSSCQYSLSTYSLVEKRKVKTCKYVLNSKHELNTLCARHYAKHAVSHWSFSSVLWYTVVIAVLKMRKPRLRKTRQCTQGQWDQTLEPPRQTDGETSAAQYLAMSAHKYSKRSSKRNVEALRRPNCHRVF